MDHLPVFLRLKGKPCLVVGGGVVAERKVRLLLRVAASVTVVAPKLNNTLTRLRDEHRIKHRLATFNAALLAGMGVVIAATNDGRINRQVARSAAAANVLCNVVDDNAASSFIVPAIVDRSPVVVAISTGGNAPVLAQTLKSQIEAWLPARIGELAERAGRWRSLIKRRFLHGWERRRFWQRFFDGPIAAHLLAGRLREAQHALRLELVGNVVPHARPEGEAYIVGAGPGDPGLVTLRAQQLISRADVVLYDRLVSQPVLDFARKDAQLVAVGKQAGRATMPQNEINELIIQQVRNGKRVCRLKGGDPFVFGRGGEEAEALVDAGLPYQIVPGISAALGCAAYAGIPLTQRGISGSVTFATAMLDGELMPDWFALARPGQTLVLYMSVASIAESAQQLIAHGLVTETPVAIVENGTTNRQRVLHSTLAKIADDVQRAAIRSPAVLIVGETAKLGEKLQWFDAETEVADFELNQELPWRRVLPTWRQPMDCSRS